MPVPVAVRSKALVTDSLTVGIECSNPAELIDVRSSVVFVCCIGSGLCDGLITHPEESYWVCRCVSDCG
jgi:hypothetical protein